MFGINDNIRLRQFQCFHPCHVMNTCIMYRFDFLKVFLGDSGMLLVLNFTGS